MPSDRDEELDLRGLDRRGGLTVERARRRDRVHRRPRPRERGRALADEGEVDIR